MSANWQAVHDAASKAGWEALEAATPRPMVVTETLGLSDQPKPGGKSWYVSEGACGFAWVTVSGNSAFGRWLRKVGLMADRNDWGMRESLRSTNEANGGAWGTGYPKGYQFWVWAGGQSIDRKEAFAKAFTQVLKDNGVEARWSSRLD